MRAGGIICAVVGALWAAGSLYAARTPAWAYAGPAVVVLILVVLTLRRPGVTMTGQDRRRIRLVVGLAFLFEVVAIWGGVFCAARAGRPDLAVSVVAGIVGLHFLPMARWMPAPRYNLTGLALMAAAVAGAALPADLRYVFVSGAAAAILWATGFSMAIGRARPASAP